MSGITLETDGGDAIVFGPGAGLDPKHNNKATFEICFGDGQPLEGKPVISTLKEMTARVDETLRLLARRALVTP